MMTAYNDRNEPETWHRARSFRGILTLLGAGGMGEVYRARDTRAGTRGGAEEILPEAFVNEPRAPHPFST